MEYAIIESGGKQYKVIPGGILEVDKLDVEPGKIHTFDKVLLYTADGLCKIGQPQVDGITVSGKVIKQFKGEKIRVAKFKAKARYRRVQGHRQLLTQIQITEISNNQSPIKQEKESKASPHTKLIIK
jgi:large subunit ribosomal protein L21